MKNIVAIALIMGVFISCSSTPKNTAENGQAVSQLEGKWLLTGLEGKAFTQNPQQREAFITFDMEKMMIAGNSSCNNFGGAITSAQPGKITFSPLRSTLMACPDLETERILYDALGRVTGYSIKGDTLSLLDDKNAVLVSYKKDTGK